MRLLSKNIAGLHAESFKPSVGPVTGQDYTRESRLNARSCSSKCPVT